MASSNGLTSIKRQTIPSSGDLRDKVGFYKRPSVTDGYGNTEGEFGVDPEFTAAARIVPRLGGESVLAQRLAGTNLVNITVRASASSRVVDTNWIVKDERNGATYNIRSIIFPDDDHRWIEMLCERGVAT